MTMTMPTTVEIINMAKEYLIERYQEQKHQCVMHWQITNDYAWSSDGQVVICPESPEYPDYEEVLELAGKIYMWFLDEQNHSTEDHSSMTDASLPMASHTGNVHVVNDTEPAANTMPMTDTVATGNTNGALGNVYLGGLVS